MVQVMVSIDRSPILPGKDNRKQASKIIESQVEADDATVHLRRTRMFLGLQHF